MTTPSTPPHAAARGCMIGLVISLAIWLPLVVAVVRYCR